MDLDTGNSRLAGVLVPCKSWFALKDQKLTVDVAFIDFCEAFDKFPLNRLLSKLRPIGIGDN